MFLGHFGVGFGAIAAAPRTSLGTLFLAAQLSILGAEISAVKARRLWPRSLMKGRFTDADLAVYEHLAASTVQDEEYEISVVVRSAPTPVRSLPSRRRRRGAGRAS